MGEGEGMKEKKRNCSHARADPIINLIITQIILILRHTQAEYHDLSNWMQFHKRKVAGIVKADHKWRNIDY